MNEGTAHGGAHRWTRRGALALDAVRVLGKYRVAQPPMQPSIQPPRKIRGDEVARQRKEPREPKGLG